MKKLKIILMFGFLGSLPCQQQASAQIALPNSVFGNGSTVVSSNDHKIVGTLAQPMIGEISSTSLIMHVGFWYIPDRFTPVNNPPIVGPITAPVDPVQAGTEINASASFTDPDPNDSHTAVWDWGDTTASSGVVDQTADTVSGSHTYSVAGVYTVTLIVTDASVV